MGATYSFAQPSWRVYTEYLEAVEKLFVEPVLLSDSCYTIQQEGFGKSVKILKHFARGKIKFVNEM